MISSMKDLQTHANLSVVVCDVCHERIVDSRGGGIVLEDPPPGKVASKPNLHVHKGQCLDAIERERAGSGALLWQELRELPCHVLQALGMTLADVADRELTWLGGDNGSQRAGVRRQLVALGENLEAEGWHSPLWDDPVWHSPLWDDPVSTAESGLQSVPVRLALFDPQDEPQTD
jgi:hypothetical protein